jgi:hypothetical protein
MSTDDHLLLVNIDNFVHQKNTFCAISAGRKVLNWIAKMAGDAMSRANSSDTKGGGNFADDLARYAALPPRKRPDLSRSIKALQQGNGILDTARNADNWLKHYKWLSRWANVLV